MQKTCSHTWRPLYRKRHVHESKTYKPGPRRISVFNNTTQCRKWRKGISERKRRELFHINRRSLAQPARSVVIQPEKVGSSYIQKTKTCWKYKLATKKAASWFFPNSRSCDIKNENKYQQEAYLSLGKEKVISLRWDSSMHATLMKRHLESYNER